MSLDRMLENHKKEMYGSKQKRIEEGSNCLYPYWQVISCLKEFERTIKQYKAETKRRSKIRLYFKCVLLSEKLHIYWNKWKKIEASYHATIPIEAEVPLSTIFPHQLTNVHISAHSHIGENCIIFHDVTIGSNTLSDSKNHGSPTIGNNVYIGAGSKILGNITVGNNVRIGANTTVVKDVEENTTCVSQEARLIKHKERKENHQW